MARGEEFMHRLVERAQAMGGTCTGEHGIGQGKQKYLKTELGPEAIDAMRALKQALDPQNNVNPGRLCRWGRKWSRFHADQERSQAAGVRTHR
jgi:D-lactate dehydrogenase (cytochrome)